MNESKAISVIVRYSLIEAGRINLKTDQFGINVLLDSTNINNKFLIDVVTKFAPVNFSLASTILQPGNIENLVELIYILMTLCERKSDKNRIVIFSETDSVSLAGINKLQEYIKKQGENNVVICLANLENSYQIIDDMLIVTQTFFKKIGIDFVKQKDLYQLSELILVTDQSDTTNEPGEILYEGKRTDSLQDIVFNIVETNSNAATERYNSLLWKQRAELYFSFIELSKTVGEKQYNDVLSWYQKEYEVLPLWYKRFGHVLKIISGRKSFKSLI